MKAKIFVFLLFGFLGLFFIYSFQAFFKPFSSCYKTYKTLQKINRVSLKQKTKFAKKADLCLEKQKTQEALLILEHLLKKTEKDRGKQNEIKKWEKKLAQISFYKTKNYEKALKYYTRLLKRPLRPGEQFTIQYHIAESFFYLQKYSQALIELEKCFFQGLSIEKMKQALELKARIFLAEKNFDLAIELFKKQMKAFPEEEKFFREYLAFIYESKKDLLSAVAELEKIKDKDSFIQQKIQRLRQRQANQPGAR